MLLALMPYNPNWKYIYGKKEFEHKLYITAQYNAMLLLTNME